MSTECQYNILENNQWYEVHESWCPCLVNNKYMWCPHLTLVNHANGQHFHYGFIRAGNHSRYWRGAENHPFWVQNILYAWEYWLFGDSYMLCKHSLYNP